MTLEQILDVRISHGIFKETHIICKLCNKANLLVWKSCETVFIWSKALSRIKQMEHLLIIFFLKLIFWEKSINEITTIFKKLFQTADIHNMNPCICFAHVHRRKMVVIEIIHIARIWLLTIDDFRLVLLVGSTIKLPKFILWQFILNFFCAVYATWAQKERKRAFLLTVSFSFC